jgi:2-polyprenyl-6-hydroxyphenyl methylase/3-demethylubiquinone-9 3-methyltransferase
MLRGAGLRVSDVAGMTMNPATGAWRTSRDLSVNYILAAEG